MRMLQLACFALALSCAGNVSTEPGNAQTASADPQQASPAETCHELAVSGGDRRDRPFEVPPGEQYHVWYFDAPWSDAVEATRFEWTASSDAIRGWSLYAVSDAAPAAGSHDVTIGSWSSEEQPLLLAALAGETLRWQLPDGVAAWLPEPGSRLALRWHYYNPSGQQVSDRSTVRICSVPAGTRPEQARLSVLGSEDFAFPQNALPLGESAVKGVCRVTDHPVTLLAVGPHLQQIGQSARLTLEKRDASRRELFSEPYDVARPSFRPLERVMVEPGDTLHSECQYLNTGNDPVGYGPSFTSETCYLFVLTTPALQPADTATLFGTTNACLMF